VPVLSSSTRRTSRVAIASCLGLLLGLPLWAQTSRKPGSHSPSHKAASTKAKTTTRHTTHSAAAITKAKKGKSGGTWRTRGQQGIDGARAREIQTALISSRYLDGQPTGVWDARTKAAMEKFQTDNGWQSKKVPDARALIKLGLGPDRTNLINPETAYMQKPEPGKGGSPQN
jgi:peptidoglycan hydrolase-like protein with peptidoglycan-binding domain